MPEPGFWSAQWVAPRRSPQEDVGAFVFRRFLDLATVPDKLPIKVSADQRFRLYINGKLTAHGPARSDLRHWFFDELDIAPFLTPGENLIHAVVWSFGHTAPMAQMTFQTAFLLEGEGVSTPSGWECLKVPGYEFEFNFDSMRPSYLVVGPGENIDGSLISSWEDVGRLEGDWQKIESVWLGRKDNSKVKGPVTIGPGKEETSGVGDMPWWMVPRSIPPMLYKRRESVPFAVNRKTDERSLFMGGTLKAGEEILLDFSELLNCYPKVKLKGTKGGEVEIYYAEALFGEGDNNKGHRGMVKGKDIVGINDVVILNDSISTFEPLWWRCFRYVLIKAKSDCTIEAFDVMETGYPLIDEAKWKSPEPDHPKLWEVSLRTARRCAGETYFDCPYYEQLQYTGDTRIQAQIGRYFSRDRRLQRQAINAFAWSEIPSGLLQSRFPSRVNQVIPGFSLWWIHMLYDSYLYDEEPLDPAWLKQADRIMTWWKKAASERRNDAYWAFSDWVNSWPAGVNPGGVAGTVQLLHLLWTEIVLEKIKKPGASLSHFGILLSEFEEKNGRVYHPDWDADAPASEHTLALRRMIQKEIGKPIDPWPSTVPENICKATPYYSWYLHQAQPQAEYEELISPWRDMIAKDLSTFSETYDPTRSDCHAWSAHLTLGWLQRTAGVTSIAKGWSKARIAPSPGRLTSFSASVPHPKGDITVVLEGGRLTVECPVPFVLEWKGRARELEPGRVVEG